MVQFFAIRGELTVLVAKVAQGQRRRTATSSPSPSPSQPTASGQSKTWLQVGELFGENVMFDHDPVIITNNYEDNVIFDNSPWGTRLLPLDGIHDVSVGVMLLESILLTSSAFLSSVRFSTPRVCE